MKVKVKESWRKWVKPNITIATTNHIKVGAFAYFMWGITCCVQYSATILWNEYINLLKALKVLMYAILKFILCYVTPLKQSDLYAHIYMRITMWEKSGSIQHHCFLPEISLLALSGVWMLMFDLLTVRQRVCMRSINWLFSFMNPFVEPIKDHC